MATLTNLEESLNIYNMSLMCKLDFSQITLKDVNVNKYLKEKI